MTGMWEQIKNQLYPKTEKETIAQAKVNDLVLSKLRLRGLSRAGLLSWEAHLDGHPVKIYECFSEQHAVFIEEISQYPLTKQFFPYCYGRQGCLIIAEWVHGQTVSWNKVRQNRELLRKIAHLQATLHTASLSDQKQIDSQLYIDFLKNRWRRYQSVLPLDQAYQKASRVLETSPLETEARVAHADLTAANLILDHNTFTLKLVDNEFLFHHDYFLFDLFNTYRSLGRTLGAKLFDPYISYYQEYGGDLTLLRKHKQFFKALWYLREIGSHLQSGTYNRAHQLAQNFLNEEVLSHPLLL